MCEPCSIEYDYIGHMETLEADLKTILKHLHAEELKSFFPYHNFQNWHKKDYAYMYRNVSTRVLQKVVDKYRVDADMFGYSFDKYLI